MAKKSRRARRRQTSRPSRTRAPATREPAQPKSVAPVDENATAAAPASRKQVDFSGEYHYVISDLRSMAVIAVAMLAVLVALSFIIR